MVHSQGSGFSILSLKCELEFVWKLALSANILDWDIKEKEPISCLQPHTEHLMIKGPFTSIIKRV
jgi:hypothetical protein